MSKPFESGLMGRAENLIARWIMPRTECMVPFYFLPLTTLIQFQEPCPIMAHNPRFKSVSVCAVSLACYIGEDVGHC